MKTKSRILAALTSAVLALSFAVPAFAASPFTDVAEGHWAYSYIQRAYSLGVVSGVGDSRFAPDTTVTNAEFATMVTQAFYPGVIDGYNNFYGESENWWTPYIESAYAKSLLSGTTVLAPRESGIYAWDEATVNGAINRYDMAQVMYNLVAKEGVTLPSEAQISTAKASISDWASIPERYQTAVATCFAAGLISGVGDGVFSGEANMTRAQAATVLCRLIDYTANA